MRTCYPAAENSLFATSAFLIVAVKCRYQSSASTLRNGFINGIRVEGPCLANMRRFVSDIAACFLLWQSLPQINYRIDTLILAIKVASPEICTLAISPSRMESANMRHPPGMITVAR